MTDISSSKFLRADYIMAISLTQNKQQGTLLYQMKNKAADLSRIGLNLIRISICVRVWKFGT
jgi:hypothetical protein